MATDLSEVEKAAYRRVGWCDCSSCCMAPIRGLRCRYRHGEIKPIEKLNKAAADAVRETLEAKS